MKSHELLPAWHRYYSNNDILLSYGQTVEENTGEMEDTQRSPCTLRVKIKRERCLEITRKGLKYVSVQKDCACWEQKGIFSVKNETVIGS